MRSVDASHTLPAIGDIVIIRGDEKNRNLWKLGKVVRLIFGRDGEIRGAKVQTSNGILERTPQHLYPLELKCDVQAPIVPLNPEVKEFRPKRKAARDAEQQIKVIKFLFASKYYIYICHLVRIKYTNYTYTISP